MGQAHPSTADERIQWVSMMLAHQGDYGLVTRLSREAQVSRRTLYLWRAQAEATLRAAFAPAPPSAPSQRTERQLLTLWINHMTDRGIQAAVREGDTWHELYGCGQVQARLQRAVTQLEQRTPAVTRQAARVAAGQRPKGRQPKTDLVAHAQDIAAARRVADGMRYLTEELRRLLAVVVLDQRGLMHASQRQADLEAMLTLVRELAESAPAPQQEHFQRLHTHLVSYPPLKRGGLRLTRSQEAIPSGHRSAWSLST